MRAVRLRAALLAAVAAALAWQGGPALADDCPREPAMPRDWCHTPTPQPTPRPTPTPPPTPAPTPTPRPATPRPTARASAPPRARTPAPAPPAPVEPTPLPTEVVPVITATPEVITSPLPTPQPADQRPARSSSPAGWAYLLVGLVIGGLAGRMSWGLSRRRRKQQIFG